MEIKYLGAIVVVIGLFFISYGSEIERQRKYVTDDGRNFEVFLQDSLSIGDFKAFFHSNYSYYDLYLDTPDRTLFKKRLSLRFRKRIFENDETQYTFQLKSEMNDSIGLRMEVEERELDFYMAPFKDNWVSLSHILDQLFAARFEPESNLFNDCLATIKQWIQMKARAPVSPFQKLFFLNPEVFNESKIQTLTPVLLGELNRKRFHIYVDTQDKKGRFHTLTENLIPTSEIPLFFKESGNNVWVMEASLDNALFYPLIPSSHDSIKIMELEVEDKYKIHPLNDTLMEALHYEMTEKLNFKPEFNSKYRQCILTMD